MNNYPAIALNLGDITVRQHNGLFSLNDLHKASGGNPNQRPGEFIRNQQIKELVEEISNAGISAFESRKGNNGGTYACRELVIAYAAWISAAFHLKVIRVFLDATTGRPYNPAIDYDRISPSQKRTLQDLVEDIVGRNIQTYGETWSRLCKKFRVNSYHELPATRFEEARDYLLGKLPEETTTMHQPTAFSQGLNAARDTALGYFSAVRAGQINAPLQDIPAPVLEGIVADSLLGKRFLTGFDYQTGLPQVQLIPRDSVLFSPQAGSFQELIHAIPMERLPELQNAMTQRMLTELGMLRRHVAMQA